MGKHMFFLFVYGLCLSCTKTTMPANQASSSGVKYYGTEAGLVSTNMIKTADGGFLFCGQAVHDGNQKFGAFLLKTKANGDMEWQKFYGGLRDDGFFSVQQTSDGGYVAVGFTDSYGLGSATQRNDYYFDAWMVKTDANGNQLWNKTFGSIYGDAFYDIAEMPDHGLIAVGWSEDTISKTNSNIEVYCFVQRTDKDGNSLWKHEYFKDRYSGYFYSVGVASNGNIAMSGGVAESDSPQTVGITYPCMLSLSADGNTTLASKVYAQFRNTSKQKILTEPDGFVLGMNAINNNSTSIYFLKTGPDGNISWQKAFAAGLTLSTIANSTNSGYSLLATNTGGIQRPQVFQMDATGDLLTTIYCENIPTMSTSPPKIYALGAIPINNGWAFGVGIAPTYLNGNSNFALIFTDSNGKITDEGK